MSFESFITMIPFLIAWFSYSIWMYEREEMGKNDWRLMLTATLSTIAGVASLFYIYLKPFS